MDALFPLKLNIPDDLELDNYEPLIINTKEEKDEKIICFILSFQEKTEEIKIDTRNKIYPLGKIIKNEIPQYIYYIEAYFSNSTIKIETSKNASFIKLENFEFSSKKNFLFNKFYISYENNFEYKSKMLNCFDIYEEFEIYYKIHSEQQNMNSLNSLIKSTINKIKNVPKEYDFYLFLVIFIKAPYELIKNNIDNILINLKNKGDLTKISKNELYNVINNIKEKRIILIICLIYMILSEQKIEEIQDFLQRNGIKIMELIYCMDKYKNIFLHSLKLFPDYSFIINNASSLEDCKIILKCSKNLVDFVYSVNANKEFILKHIRNAKINNILLLNDFFDIENEFDQKFGEDFYFK